MHKRLWLLLLLLPLLGAGCVSFRSSVATEGGVFRSINSAEDWEARQFIRQEKKKQITIGDANVIALAFDPQEPARMVIGTNEDGMFQTENAGESWAPLSLQNGSFSEIDVHPKQSQTLIASNSNMILRSEDSGQTWSTIYTETTQTPIVDVKFDALTPSRLFALTQNGAFLVSTDNGINWEVVSRVNVNVVEMVLHPRDSGIIFIQSEKDGILKTTDQGLVWSNVSKEQLKSYSGANVINDLELLPSRPNTLYLATAYGLFGTTDGGFQWTPVKTLLPPKTAVHRVAVDRRNPSTFYFTVGRIIHKTTDGGETWKVIENFPSSRVINVFEPHPASSDILFAGMLKPKK